MAAVDFEAVDFDAVDFEAVDVDAADFDAAVALNGGRPDPDGMYGRYFTSTGNLNKVAGYSSPELDALFAQGKTTSDTAARKQIYTKMSDALEANADSGGDVDEAVDNLAEIAELAKEIETEVQRARQAADARA